MSHAHKTDKRKATNVTLPESLIAEARERGINLSRVSEEGIRAAIKQDKEQKWLAENAEAIKAHNEWFEKNGPLYAPIWTLEN